MPSKLYMRGYVKSRCARHPRADPKGYVWDHVLAAERVLGRYLVWPEQVHHIDGNRANNANSNLVVCPDTTYHALLHQRARSLKESGTPEWRRCKYCKRYDATENLRRRGTNRNWQHLGCERVAARSRYARRKETA